MSVYVLDRKGRPLMPTERYGHVRKLLKAGLAVPVSTRPFVIRLKYDATRYTQPLYAGIDSGRENVGLAVSDAVGRRILLQELDTHNKSIRKQMADRKAHRVARRAHKRRKKQRKALRDGNAIQKVLDDKLGEGPGARPCGSIEIRYPGAEEGVVHKVCRGKEAKFNNRVRPEGWLTPSARQLVQVHRRLLEETLKILPVTHVILERAAFDFQRLENEAIESWEYGKGPLYGFKGYKDFVRAAQGGRCLICGRDIECYHHVRPRKDGGTDRVGNITGLCRDCHEAVHNDKDTAERLAARKGELTRDYSVGCLNSAMAAIIEDLEAFCRDNGMDFLVIDGYETKATRDRLGIGKSHALDAYAISLAGREVEKANQGSDVVWHRDRFKKASENCVSKLGRREYVLDGEVVAVGRHKAMDQKIDSLAEHMARYAEDHGEIECRQHFHELEVRPARRIYTYRKRNQRAGLDRTGKVKAPVRAGDLVCYEKPGKPSELFVADRVKMSHKSVCCGTKEKSMKFVRLIQSSLIPVIDWRLI